MINNNLTVGKLLPKYKKILKDALIETYSLDCELLLMNAINFSKIQLYTTPEYELTAQEFETFNIYIKRRLQKEPIAYIINKCEFMGLNFYVDKNTLIPREDTEILVEKVIEIINQNNFKQILDIGTGSGALAISIAKYCKNVKIIAIDVSLQALEIARKNAILNKVSKNISFLCSSLFDKLDTSNFDIIVSNPPYIKTEEIKLLDENVKNFEPYIALNGGNDGLDFYRKITSKAPMFLVNKGYLCYEIGFDQSSEVFKILKDNNFININIIKDLKGFNRVIFGNLR